MSDGHFFTTFAAVFHSTVMNKLTSQQVSLGEKVGYSLGDAAANLVFQMMMIFQLKFYTDVFGLNGAIAGSVLMMASLSAIIVDPTVGLLCDRTNTRWGKFRPWMLWTLVPFCLFYILAFYYLTHYLNNFQNLHFLSYFHLCSHCNYNYYFLR